MYFDLLAKLVDSPQHDLKTLSILTTRRYTLEQILSEAKFDSQEMGIPKYFTHITKLLSIKLFSLFQKSNEGC